MKTKTWTLTRRAALSLAAGAMALSAAATMPGGAAVAQDDPLKVGFVYVGPVGDHGWTYQHDKGRQAVVEKFGDAVKTTYVESVPEGADAERVINQLAQSGHDLIFTTSFGFMNPTVKVAKRYPDVMFEHATGYKRADNVSTYAGRFYEGRYPIGVMAGRLTESDTIGYIAPFPIPEVVRGINAFTKGLHSVNPDASVKIIYVNSWYDPGKEREAAETLVAQGADILVQHTDSAAPMQLAEEKGLIAFGQASDMSQFGPNAQATAIVDDWSDYYIDRVQAVMDGTWESQDTWGGLNSGMVQLSDFGPKVPEDVAKEATQIVKDIESGDLVIFEGPIKDNAGEVRIAEGEAASEEDLLSMDWYIEGIDAQLPKN
ncbi:Bmp family protein [Caenispirillum salinarum AK4]|uniref:Bmp family protein n=1 Tax=Caenispirillum salinarum AK4 TaxID=1238182 RepID=K9H129_9PROT|nr:Bmp family protein [Caenispirillum salinarum AK4]